VVFIVLVSSEMATLFPDASQGRYIDKMGARGGAMTLQTVFNFEHLNEDVRLHLKRVYLLLSFTVIAASVGSWLASYYIAAASAAILPVFLMSIAIILAIGLTPSTQENAKWVSSVCLFA
jgi:uncharacterized membrane protein YfcA